MPRAEEQIDAIARILHVEVEALGGGLRGFTFELPDGRWLVFSHSDGPLGYALDSVDGVNLCWECMDRAKASVAEQAEYVRQVCRQYGVMIPPGAREP